jgi:cytochrome b561
MSQIHMVTAALLVVLIVAHVAAAFKHLLVERDAVFGRMWR